MKQVYLLKVSMRLVYEYAVRYDEGHWGETPRAVYYEMLTAPLIVICKDQKAKIEALEARVAALES